MPLLDAGTNVFLRACPGAGKTHQVVSRYLTGSSEEARKGIALLSFSNSAVDEARDRCSGNGDALRAPNFVGTFDAFVHRFITTPYLVANGKQPRYVEEWSQIAGTEVRLRGNDSAIGFALEWFDFKPDGSCTLDLDSPHSGFRRSHHNLAQRKLTTLCTAATHQWLSLVGSGLLSCSAARTYARDLLTDDIHREQIGLRLTSRFAELIVDEMQDCGTDELDILKLCSEFGLNLVLVADLDQSIYGFRNAVPREVEHFAATLTELPELMTNGRSTPEICAINSSLRFGRQPESAIRESLGIPIHLIVGGQPQGVRDVFLALTGEQEIVRDDTIVLAHRLKDAETIAGANRTVKKTVDRVILLALAIIDLSDPLANPKTKVVAQQQIERQLLGFIGVTGNQSVKSLIDEAGINERWFRRLVAGTNTYMRDQVQDGRSEFTDSLKNLLADVSWPDGHSLVSGAIRKPREDTWSDAIDRDVGTDVLRSATIHSVKGKDFPAVLLSLPERPREDENGLSVLDHWEQDKSSEVRRVLYVGSSRAIDLLAIAVPATHSEQVIRTLELVGVEHSMQLLDT